MDEESSWITEPFRVGLLGTGATLAARVLDPPLNNTWITNILIGEFPRVFAIHAGTSSWFGPFAGPVRLTPHFPYGYGVMPP